MSGICFKEIEYDMKFEHKNNLTMKNLICIHSLKGKVDFNSENLNKKTILVGNIQFVEGTPRVCRVIIDQKIQIIHLLSTIFSKDKDFIWSKDYPYITFNKGEIYYTFIQEDKIEIDKIVYYKGYNINAHIDFFGMENFLMTARINNGIKIKVTEEENSEINLGFAKIIKYNLIIESNTKNHSININGYLKLFDMNPAEFQLNYEKKTKCLEGEIKMKGSLLGVDNPTIKGYWSKSNKFVITNWPSFHKLVWDTEKFASIIEEASINLGEIIISDLKLNENFEDHFYIDLKQLETQDDSLVSFSVTGKYLIRIIGGKEEAIEIAGIDIPSIQLDIKYPSDILKLLLKYFKKELPKNVLQNLLKDSENFVKFIDSLAISTLINLSESALEEFMHFTGDKINKLSKKRTFKRLKEH
ncbi:31066_t:CDS:2 [Gigaspora margarita]|uniref:31066_t:CDS:1 n=1 Tax=Gigaspora margarita TaxID=4874 RepID=A0ABN7VB17_GIGMA|nr:31066_t:CDS:2 [Gigaspora margarita]